MERSRTNGFAHNRRKPIRMMTFVTRFRGTAHRGGKLPGCRTSHKATFRHKPIHGAPRRHGRTRNR